MLFMSFYYCMLLTNWIVIDPNSTATHVLSQSWQSFWVKFVLVILTFFLYIYVLIAPRLFPDREFDF